MEPFHFLFKCVHLPVFPSSLSSTVVVVYHNAVMYLADLTGCHPGASLDGCGQRSPWLIKSPHNVLCVIFPSETLMYSVLKHFWYVHNQ